ncbi:MAG: FecR domain-containing protein [Alphaproteobacteria bacterium]
MSGQPAKNVNSDDFSLPCLANKALGPPFSQGDAPRRPEDVARKHDPAPFRLIDRVFGQLSESSYRSLLDNRGYAALLCSQFLGAYKDNLFKMVVSLLAVGAMLTPELVEVLVGPRAPGQYAQAGAPESAAPIGQVETLSATAQATRADGTTVQLNVGDPVFQGDVVQTGTGSSLGITFVDGTIFSLSAGARMVLNSVVYDPDGTSNSMPFNLIQGTFVFVTRQVASTGSMRVETPIATLGIRG